jgi:hypothetical protein
MQKGSEKKRKIEQEKKNESVIGLAIVLIIVIAIAGGAAWYFISGQGGSTSSTSTPGPTAPSTGTGDPTLTTCINDANLAEHIHPHLSIIINGQAVAIPADIGITPTCTRPVHTHDDTGTIHVESPVVYPFTVHDFFLVWGKQFDSTKIFEYNVDSTHTLTMTVNGAPNTQFQNYVMQDGDDIVITYASTS